MSEKQRKYKKIFCSHCHKYVCKSTWYKHYNEHDGSDHRNSQGFSTREFDFGSGESSDDNADYADLQDNADHADLQTTNRDDTEALLMSDESDDNGIEVWSDEDEDDFVDARNQQNAVVDTQLLKLTHSIASFILSWQAIFKIPDTAISVLLHFLQIILVKVFSLLSKQSKYADDIVQIFPKNIDQARKFLSIERDNFQRLILCSECHSVYNSEDVLHKTVYQIVKCSHVRFPHHPQKRMRCPCNFPLVKMVKTSSGKHILQPVKQFCYKSVVQSIKELVVRPGAINLLSHWKRRCIPSGILADIYDGVVWKSFVDSSNGEFLGTRYGIGLLINVDWFQPYKHVQYSVGVIYLSILNLPRPLRYRRENMIIVGIIPGPHEPSLHINSFLEAAVIDLMKLWQGVNMVTLEGEQTVRAAVICNSSDVPACRKVGGFVGHAALKACSRCLKSFPTRSFGEKADYSGFDVSSWPKRSIEQHRPKALSWKHARTQTERTKIEHEEGVRFSELLRLPYFNTVRYSVIDPMHNIFLGSAKMAVITWKEKGILTPAHFDSIQCLVDKFIIPPDVGRIPHKISSGFSSFTADQWKNWTLIYSLVVLKDVLSEPYYKCWHLFVQASRLICSRAISQDSLRTLDSLLVKFCQKFEDLYGKSACTPNMHFHCHLASCVADFGPPTSFWLFACERLNGLLGSMPTNNRCIEIQLMRKFFSSQEALQTLLGSDESVQNLLSTFHNAKGSLKHEDLPELPLPPATSENLDNISLLCKLMPSIKEGCFQSDAMSLINRCLREYFGESYLRTLMLHTYCSAVQICGILYGSVNNIHSSSALVYVRSNSGNYLPGFVKKYVKAKIFLRIGSETPAKELTMALIEYLTEFTHKNWYGIPAEVWTSDTNNQLEYIPVTSIVCRCAYITKSITINNGPSQTVIVIVPLNHFSGI